jgi:hypothetical protein
MDGNSIEDPYWKSYFAGPSPPFVPAKERNRLGFMYGTADDVVCFLDSFGKPVSFFLLSISLPSPLRAGVGW